MGRTVTVTFDDDSQHVYQNVPDGVTPNDIESRATSEFSGKKLKGIDGGRFQQTAGGGVTGIQIQPRLLSPAGEAAKEIAGAGGVGALMGAAAPEILTGIAGGLRQIPQGARVAPLVESAAVAARAAGRPATAISGGVSGLASEVAGQAVEATGGPQIAAEGARFVAGALAPESATAVRFLVELWKKKLPTTLEASALKNLSLKIAARLEGRPQDIDAEEAALLNRMVGEFRGGEKTDAPLKGVYDALSTGAKTRLAVGEQEAKNIIGNANSSIQKELDDLAKSGKYTTEAADRIRRRGEDALATAQLQRLNIGDDLPPSDIGNSLRSVITGRNQSAIEARRAQDAVLREGRDKLVSNLEASGQHVDHLPRYKLLVDSLRAEMAPGKHSPDVADNFSHILNQITTKAKESKSPFGGMGSDPFAALTEKRPPVSFQQLDDVRRQLGQVFEGNPPEGYKALEAATARKYYGLIADLQKQYAGGDGGAHDLLQRAYADSTRGLEMFGSKSGKRVTAVDRYDDTKFQTDAAALPKQFFSTSQGIKDLVELAGDRGAVVKAALNFATSELDGLSEKQVREWMTKRREMLFSLPEVRSAVLKYANTLQHGEGVSRAAEGGVSRLSAYQAAREKMTGGTVSSLERDAASRAAQITSQRGQEAISLLGPKGQMFPAQNVRALIESGTSKQWELAAPAILASPGGKETLAASVRQVMADRALVSVKGLSDFFNNNVRPAMTATKLMDETRMSQISQQLDAIENMKLPEKAKFSMASKVVLQGLAGYASGAASRLDTSLVNLVPQ